jgi:hypothetical protein
MNPSKPDDLPFVSSPHRLHATAAAGQIAVAHCGATPGIHVSSLIAGHYFYTAITSGWPFRFPLRYNA